VAFIDNIYTKKVIKGGRIVKNLKKFLSILLAIILCLSTTNVQVLADTAPTLADHVVINQVYGGGGNSGAPYSNDYIELYNPTDSAVDLSGWSVQYGSSGGTSYSNITILTGTIQPGGYYLIQENAGANASTELPSPDSIGSISMSASNGKVALASNSEAVTSKDDTDIVDFVGFGSANEYEGSAAAPTLNNENAAIRSASGSDTDDNAIDFVKATPTPRNSSYTEVIETKCSTPTSDTAEGAVLMGKTINFSSSTSEATIEYNTELADSVTWTTGSSLVISEDITYFVRAIKAGLDNSDVASFTYTIDTSAPISIAAAKAVANDTENVKTKGIVTYISYNNVYIQDGSNPDTDAICLRLTENATGLLVGDSIIATGTRGTYFNLNQLNDVVEADIIIESNGNPLPEMATASINQIVATSDGKTPGYDYMCEFVSIEGAVLTSTSLLTQDGAELTIYPSVNLDDFVGVAEGDTVNVIARLYDYKGTLEIDITSISIGVPAIDTTVIHAKDAAVDTTDLLVKGIVTYISYQNVYIQDNNDAICLRLTESALTLKLGDSIVAKGTRAIYGNLIQLSDVVEADIIIESSDNSLPVSDSATIAEILATPDGKTPGFDHMCEFITIKDVVLTSTILLSQNGSALPLYPAIDLSGYAGVTEGATVDVTVRVNDYKGTIQAEVTELKLPDAPLTIKEVLELGTETEDVTVIGQIAYLATTYANPVLQSAIDGETYSLYVFGGAPDGAKVGDVIKMNGKFTIYNGLPEFTGILSSSIVSTTEPPMLPETMTLAEINANGLAMLGRFVKIENVELGVYNGSGSTTITDATGSSSIYRATEYPVMVEAGDIVDLYAMIACYKTSVQLYTGTSVDNGFNIYDITNDIKAPLITLPDNYLDAKALQDYIISIEAADNKGIDEVTITYTISGTTVTDKDMVKNPETGKYEVIIPATELLADATTITFIVSAKDVTGLTSTTEEQTINIVNKPEFSSVTPTRNSSTGDNKTPVISVSLTNAGTNPTVTLTLENETQVILSDMAMTANEGDTYSFSTLPLEDGKYKATVIVVRTDGKSNTETWIFYVGESQFNAYFGQFHAHTAEYSDGSGTLTDGLNYLASIPDSDNVDFVSFTDHSNYYDSTSKANPAEALNDKSLMSAESLSKWNQYTSTIDTFNETNVDSKSALAGFEMTWSGGPGHINTFNSDGLISRNNTALNSKSSDSGLKAYYETLIADTDELANLSQFNHPGKTFGTFSDFAYWSPSYDNKMVMIEVGNGEGAIGSGGYFPSYSEYTKALDKGWHVAPSNNQDNHKGRWGNANTARTVILTDDFSSTGILTAMKNMTLYATEDKNLNINYTVNDLIMGSIISEIPSTPLQFSINIDDDDTNDVISKVEIITNGGRIAASETFDSNVADMTFELPANQGYYYVRVTQADKNMAVTAPVWVGQAPLVGISSLEVDTKLPVTGESLNLTTTLFNNEDSAVTLKSITYTINGETLSEKTLSDEIVAGGTYADVIAYTPSEPLSKTVIATAIVMVNGQEKIFTAELELDVLASEQLVYVGIDASHFNEYVDGNYKDSMGNFANMAVDYNVRVVELTTEEELISAANNPKFKMLVLTPPTRRNGNNFLLGYKNYSTDVITAIESFAKVGGTLIITGWADYYENYSSYTDGTPYALPAEEDMSAQQNSLLAAIGSTLRVSDDEIKDDVNNGGQPQRLYLTEYDLNNLFLDGVKPAEQVYSNYGGSTIYGLDSDSQPTTTLAASVSPMVYAFDTSYSADEDSDGTTDVSGVVVPKYNNKYMVAASETLTHDNGVTSTVIVAGSAFMSNFEIQAELDNYLTPAYSNFTILENIVNIVNPVVISSIADVHAAEEGWNFTIRGIATSNASGYDKETAFFDCIYVQDSTAGINAFPVAEVIMAGQTVEITGKTSSYNGERQILVKSVKIIDETVKELPEPINLTVGEAASGKNLGSLVTVSGKVKSIELSNGVVESIYVSHGKDVCRVFIDGYITSTKNIPGLKVGKTVIVTGLSSINTNGPRIRVRDRADIQVLSNSSTKNPKVITDEDVPLSSPFGVATFSAETKGSTATITVNLTQLYDENATSLVITSDIGTLTFDEDTLNKFKEDKLETIDVVIKVLANKDLDPKTKQLAGGYPVYDFSILSGDLQVTEFGGKVTVKVPYNPLEQNGHAMVVYYITDEGTLEMIMDGYYEDGYYVFTTSHFSKFLIRSNLVHFNDVNGWYKEYVDFLSARSIMKGKGNNAFDPKGIITKAEVVQILANYAGAELKTAAAQPFNDVETAKWYASAIAWAKEAALITGTDGNFMPNEAITREELAVLIADFYLYMEGKELPELVAPIDFTDIADADKDALESIRKLQLSGIVNGTPDGKFLPSSTATRAEAAKIFTLLLKKL